MKNLHEALQNKLIKKTQNETLQTKMRQNSIHHEEAKWAVQTKRAKRHQIHYEEWNEQLQIKQRQNAPKSPWKEWGIDVIGK